MIKRLREWWIRRPRRTGVPMPARFYPLADYNGERARGLLHDDATRDRMARLQVEFDEWIRTRYEMHHR